MRGNFLLLGTLDKGRLRLVSLGIGVWVRTNFAKHWEKKLKIVVCSTKATMHKFGIVLAFVYKYYERI